MQAAQLETLHTNLLADGMSELSVFIVNSKIWHSQLTVQMLETRVSFPVYQETYDESIWDVLEGDKDDMYVYDRCGRLVEFIPFPLSILSKDNVKKAIWKAYYDEPCGPCTKNHIKETSTKHSTEAMLVTTEASFNLTTSRCQYDLERCDTLLSDPYLAKCCAEMFGNPEVIQEPSQCINLTEKRCDELQMTQDCCKEMREQQCMNHNESQCFELLENKLHFDDCCDQLQTDTNDTQCLNITSETCKDHKHNKLCCKQSIHNHTTEESHQHGTDYKYTCRDYDEIKCAALAEEQMLSRCCENSQNVTDEVEDLNYDAECHNVTKVPCDSVQFALDCCNLIKNGSQVQGGHIKDSKTTSQYHKNQGHHGQKEHHGHEGHHGHESNNGHEDHHQSSNEHKHRHHHGEINYDNKKHHKQKSDHHSNSREDANESSCGNFSLDKCKGMQNSLRRVIHCCTESKYHYKCRLIVSQCPKIKHADKCCQVIFENKNEIKNQKQIEKSKSQVPTSTEIAQSDTLQQDDKNKLNK